MEPGRVFRSATRTAEGPPNAPPVDRDGLPLVRRTSRRRMTPKVSSDNTLPESNRTNSHVSIDKRLV